MINIAIIDQNQIFRESLKILLEQINGFRVVTDTDDSNFVRIPNTIPIQVLLIDKSLGKEKCDKVLQEIHLKNEKIISLTLVMFKEDLIIRENQPDLILKSSCKKEFEEKIRSLLNF